MRDNKPQAPTAQNPAPLNQAPPPQNPAINPVESKGQNKPALAIMLTLLAVCGFATMDAGTKYLTGAYHPLQIVFVRFSIYVVGAGLFSLFVYKSIWPMMKTGKRSWQIIRGLILTVEISLAALSFKLLPLATAQTLILTFPLFISLLSGLVLKEQVGPHRRLAIIIGFIGVLVILRPGMGAIMGEDHGQDGWQAIIDPALLIGLFTGFLFGIYNLITRHMSKFSQPASAISLVLWPGIVALIVIGPFLPSLWVPPTLTDWFLLLGVGSISLLAHSFLIIALRLAPTPILQPFNYFLLLGGVFYGVVLFDEWPDHFTIIGALLILAGGLYTFWREWYHSHKAKRLIHK